MSKNIIINGTTYSGISTIRSKTSGGTTDFKDIDEILTPSGSITITSNGTHDVTNYASADVNVESGGSFSATELPVTYHDAGAISSMTITDVDGSTIESTTSNSSAARYF